MNKGDLTVIIARFAEGPVRKYTFSRKLLLVTSATALILCVSFLLSTLHYYYMWKKVSDYSELETTIDQLRRENEGFRLSANSLNEKVSSLEMTSKKLKIVSGLDRQGLGGMGGPLEVSGQLIPLSNKEIGDLFTDLDKKSGDLEVELRRLQDFYTNQSILWAATPVGMPVRGYPSDGFGNRLDPFNGEPDFHVGVDISAPYGNKVIATADGMVLFAGRSLGYGKMVSLDHKFGISTRYGHLSRLAVGTGQKVKKGDVIGYVGSTGRATGPHLHYEVRLNNQPLNPMRFFQSATALQFKMDRSKTRPPKNLRRG
ncbi:MAG: M23 family metallopeptidase [Acidobacteria bacterium]|nr:M23 family metallopeptidase [Acidobacteriota bacterium]